MFDEARFKQTAAQAYENEKMAQGQCGEASSPVPQRESMTGRLRNDLSTARRESRKANDLEELLYLLDKHPEIARILDLVDALGNKY